MELILQVIAVSTFIQVNISIYIVHSDIALVFKPCQIRRYQFSLRFGRKEHAGRQAGDLRNILMCMKQQRTLNKLIINNSGPFPSEEKFESVDLCCN